MRRHRCYACGAKENLKKCRCGHLFCPLHGVGDLCSECYSKSLVAAAGVVRVQEAPQPRAVPKESAKMQEKASRKAEEFLISSRLRLESLDRSRAMAGIYRTLHRYRFISLVERRVTLDAPEGPVVVLFHWDRIFNTIDGEAAVVDVVTHVDPRLSGAIKLVGEDLERIAQVLPKVPLSERYDAYRCILHHNEISWLTGVILVAMGFKVDRAEMGYMLRTLPLATYGPLCPWCGVAKSAKRGRCRNCGRVIPDDYPADEFIESHLKRQFTDQLVALEMRRRELELGPEEYARRKRALLSLKDAIGTLKWGSYQPVQAR